MLYTQQQLISFATHCLREARANADISQASRLNWEEKNNIQPLQEGQPISITTIDGITINATIDSFNTIPVS